MMTQVSTKLEAQGAQAEAAKLLKDLEDPAVWDNPAKANKLAQRHGALKGRLDELQAIEEETDNAVEMAQLAAAEGEDQEAIFEECTTELRKLLKRAKRFRVEMLLNGMGDEHGCFIEVTAGAGGHEACDFAEMLLNMYSRWGTASGYEARITERHPGAEAGVKSATVHIRGHNAYGWTKGECGTHRMVRVSEFDTQGRRHTAFARVAVLPSPEGTEDGEGGDLEIPMSDLRIETMRSRGPGGQSVNTTDSAVRITHLPTGIQAQSQQERSQHANKAYALAVLKARLLQTRIEEEQRKRSEFTSTLGDNTWGNQIRSYVLHPYKMVKDHRTGHETSNAEAVFEGDPRYLTPFMESVLERAADLPQAEKQEPSS